MLWIGWVQKIAKNPQKIECQIDQTYSQQAATVQNIPTVCGTDQLLWSVQHGS